MTSKNILITLTILASLWVGSQSFEYDPELGLKFAKAADLAYCCPKNLEKWNCGKLCLDLQSTITYVNFVEKYSPYFDKVAYGVFRDDNSSQLIFSFRGTNTVYQMFLESVFGKTIEYPFHSIPNATVDNTFSLRYQSLRDTFLKEITSIYESYPNFTYVFTGHSLGAGLSTHAALDVALLGIVPLDQIQAYNYGSPRVGNWAFSDMYDNLIPDTWRVVHYNDVFVPSPDCFKDPEGNCVHGTSQAGYGKASKDESFYWHTNNQVFYSDDQSSYKLCTAEEPDCADSFTDKELQMQAHFNYIGVVMGCGEEVPVPDRPGIPDFNRLENWHDAAKNSSACVKFPGWLINLAEKIYG